MTEKKDKHINIVVMIILDILGIGVGLMIYALFHHVLPSKLEGDNITVSRPEYSSVSETSDLSSESSQNSTLTETSITSNNDFETTSSDTVSTENTQQTSSSETEESDSQTSDVTYTPISSDFGMWGEKFRDKFTDGEVIKTADQYISNSINVKITRYSDGELAYYLADIYVKNIDNFKTAFAQDSYGKSLTDGIVDMSQKNNAIVATNGDYYGIHDTGLVIRNGVVYRSNIYSDACVIYYDGTMETYESDEFNIDDAVAKGAYQGWTFGPSLIKKGTLITDFSNYGVKDENPRTALGYFEPGHYCLLTVDGRAPGYSNGLTLKGLAELMYSFGCTEAYNMDGGGSSMMTFDGELINEPWKNGRESSDLIFIGE